LLSLYDGGVGSSVSGGAYHGTYSGNILGSQQLSSLSGVRKANFLSPMHTADGPVSPISRLGQFLTSPISLMSSAGNSPGSLPTTVASFESLLLCAHRPRPFYFVIPDEDLASNKVVVKLAAADSDTVSPSKEVKVLIFDECAFAIRTVAMGGNTVGVGKAVGGSENVAPLSGFITSSPVTSPYDYLAKNLTEGKSTNLKGLISTYSTPSLMATSSGIQSIIPSPHLALPHGELYSFSSFFHDLILHPGEAIMIPCILRATAATGIVEYVFFFYTFMIQFCLNNGYYMFSVYFV
jgi:hypothetical protein